MIKRPKDGYTVGKCDGKCNAEIRIYAKAWEQIKRRFALSGWKLRKIRDGVWECRCGNCSPKESKQETDSGPSQGTLGGI